MTGKRLPRSSRLSWRIFFGLEEWDEQSETWQQFWVRSCAEILFSITRVFGVITCGSKSKSGATRRCNRFVRNKAAYLHRLWVCSGKGFPLRVEEKSRIPQWACGKIVETGEGWFAIKLAEVVYMIPYFTIKAFMNESHPWRRKTYSSTGKPPR